MKKDCRFFDAANVAGNFSTQNCLNVRVPRGGCPHAKSHYGRKRCPEYEATRNDERPPHTAEPEEEKGA